MMMYTLAVFILFCAFFEVYLCQPEPSREADLRNLGNYQAKLKSYWTRDDELMRIAKELVRLHEYSEAIPFFSKAIKYRPHKYSYYRERGNCYSQMGKWSEAYSDLKQEWILYQYSGDETDMNSREIQRLCRNLTDNRFYNEAVLCFTEAIQKDPSELVAYKQRGDCYKTLKKYDLAKLDYREALTKNPKDKECRTSLIRVLFLAGESEQAAAEMQFMTDVDLGRLGDEFCNREGKFREGIYCYTEASNQSHLDPEYNLKRGICFEEMNDLEEAINDYRNALQKKPNDVAISEKLILALFKAMRVDEAARVMWLFIDFSTTCSEVADRIVIQGLSNNTLKSLGESFTKAKNFDQAISIYTEAIERNSDDALSYNSRGSCYLAMENLDSAISDFERAVKLAPNNMSCLFNWITALFKIGRSADAVEKLNLLEEPKLYSMGNTLLQEGRATEALECFTEAIRKNPNNSGNHEKAGLSYLLKGDFDMAKLETERAMNLLPAGDNRRRDLEVNWCEKLVEARRFPEARFALKNVEVTYGRYGLPASISDKIDRIREKMAELEQNKRKV